LLVCASVNEDLPLCWVVPSSLRDWVCTLAHYTKVAGHPGATKLTAALGRQWFWPSMSRDCVAVVRSCPACVAKRHKRRPKRSVPLTIFPPHPSLRISGHRCARSPSDHPVGNPIRFAHYRYYGAETLRGNSMRWIENLRLLIVFCLGPFSYTQELYFDSRFHLYISRGTDTIMTQYDTGRTEIPFGPFDVCIWVSPVLVQDSPIEGTPHQCPSCGIFSSPLN
jgi:Integrase zinc binding domain